MHLYFAGAEIPGWRRLLADQGVTHVAMSFMGQRRRTKKPYALSELFLDNQHIFLDSGAYTINQEDAKYTVAELEELAEQYYDLVGANIDRIDMFSEFDAKVLGPGWIETMRSRMLSHEEKALPIWHPEDGVPALDILAGRFARIGVMSTEVNGRDLTPTLNGLVSRYGTKLHGVAMTKPDDMRAVKWDSVASTSWISPSRFGDTIVWTGNELKRYPKAYKDQARKRHRTLFQREGFNSEAIENDDTTEVLKLSIWSWQHLVADIERHGVTMTPETATPANTEFDSEVVDTTTVEVRNPGPVVVRERAYRTVLPILGMRTESNDDGEEIVTPFMRSSSTRQCNTCFLAAKCPAMEKDTNCAYEIPVEIRTKDQYRALYDSLIEMQAQRVMFMRFAEEAEGGYADPNLSQEIKLLDNLINKRHEMDQENFSLKVEARGPAGQAGMISRLFGREAGQAVQALPTVIDADSAIQQITG